jgi:hypothetical protein
MTDAGPAEEPRSPGQNDEPAPTEEPAPSGAAEGPRASAPPKRARTPGPADERPSVIDQVADLLQMASDWVRQEAEEVVHDKLVIPMQRLGLTLASAYAAGCLLVLGLFWIEIAAIMFLGVWLHAAGLEWVAAYATAFLIIGGVMAIASAIFLAIRLRFQVPDEKTGEREGSGA